MYWQGHDHTLSRLDQMSKAVQTALRLAPDAGEPHLALADYHYHGFRDYEQARTELDIARRTLPNNSEVFGTPVISIAAKDIGKKRPTILSTRSSSIPVIFALSSK